MTQPYSIVSSTSALSIRILSSRRALGWSYSLRVYFRKLHHALRMRRSTSMDRSALWILSSRGALDRPYSSRVYFRKLHHALRMRRSTSMNRSALWLTFPPRYTNSFVWLYTWPATSTLNVAVDSGIGFARKHMISVLATYTLRPNAAHTTTITPIIFLSFSGDSETTTASSA